MLDLNRRTAAASVIALALALAGCAGPAGSADDDTELPVASAPASAASHAPAASVPSPASARPSASAAPASAVAEPVLDQDWATAALVDVATGDSFRIADHAGKVIIVETMAIWCSNCRAQQRDVQSALQELDPGSVVYVVLDVDPNEDAASLASYQTQNGFAGRYAIADPTVARALADEFGDQVLNPPATPVVLIGTDGRVTLTEYGHKSVDELIELATTHGA